MIKLKNIFEFKIDVYVNFFVKREFNYHKIYENIFYRVMFGLGSFIAFAAMSDEDFITLCRNSSAEKIEEALEQGAFVSAHNNYWSPLLAATHSNSDPKVIELLAEFGVAVNEIASDYFQVYNYGKKQDWVTMYKCMPTSIMLVAYCSPNPGVVRALVQSVTDVNAMTEYRAYLEATPLFWAVLRPMMKSPPKTEATQSAQSNGKGLLSAGTNKTEALDDSDPRTTIVKDFN